jgi:ATP-binding cassette subfamily F protein 3
VSTAAKAAASPPSAKPSAGAPAAKAGANRNDDRKAAAQARTQIAAQTRPLRIEVQQIDARLEKLGAERSEIEASMSTGTLGGPEIAEAGRRLNHVGAEIAMLEERWLELSEQIEALQAGG